MTFAHVACLEIVDLLPWEASHLNALLTTMVWRLINFTVEHRDHQSVVPKLSVTIKQRTDLYIKKKLPSNRGFSTHILLLLSH